MNFSIRFARLPSVGLLFVLATLAGWPRIGRAADHFLTIGGGDSPSNNQVSLEKNVLFFQRLLSHRAGSGVPFDVLFADGSAGGRDVQLISSQPPPKVNLLLARLFDKEGDLSFQYRPHKVPHLRGPSTREALQEWFDNTGSRLPDGDRLFIYFTGHGGGGNPPRNTTLSMWCEQPMPVTEFNGLLNKLPPKVSVVLMMVQCHSGGFADVIFKDARPAAGLADAHRCGFFATTFDRNAAGCTPDTVEEDYRDYSTYFFAALDGKTRTGKPLSAPDYDGDGRVSLAEAHAYAVLTSDTIDIPLTSSEVLLREFSKTTGAGALLTADAPYDVLLKSASPAQQAILKGLSEKLDLRGPARTSVARKLAENVMRDWRAAGKQRGDRTGERNRMAENIRRRILRKWPELSNPWHARAAELMKQDGADIEKAIESDRNYNRFDQARVDADEQEEKELDLERKWVKCQRFIRTAETVALAANIDKTADPAIVERYRQMLEEEGGTLSGSPTREAAANAPAPAACGTP